MKISVNVGLNAFYDMGFDPRFSKDGNRYHLPISKDISIAVKERLNFALFSLKAYLSPLSKERKIRQLVLQCAKSESYWAKVDKHLFALAEIDKRSPNLFLTAEHDFFEKTGRLYQTLIKCDQSCKRIFPSELLRPIHAINKPQNETTWSADYILKNPESENGDLSREVIWGYCRLSNSFIHNLDDDTKIEQDYYVPHAQLISSINSRAFQLKKACRKWRKTLARMTVDEKCAKSFDSCRQKIESDLKRLNSCWDSYIQSHELLQEISIPYSQTDYFLKYYKILKWVDRVPNDIYMKLCNYFYNSSHKLENDAKEQAYNRLKADFLFKFSNTITGRLYAASEDTKKRS